MSKAIPTKQLILQVQKHNRQLQKLRAAHDAVLEESKSDRADFGKLQKAEISLKGSIESLKKQVP